MGLSAPKFKNKISQDPNNTTWSRSTDRFGHKILTAQGWAPGDTLGVKHASHSDHYTAASSSHIRVLLRDDNLGLGAKRNANADQFGLDMFAGLLGRLNGKSDDELLKEEGRRRDARLAGLAGHKYGMANFVFGGLLVGDKIEESLDVAIETSVDVSISEDVSSSKHNKRKRAEDGEIVNDHENSASKLKKRKTVPETTQRAVEKETKRKSKREENQKAKAEIMFAEPTEDDSTEDKATEILLDTRKSDEKAEKKRQKVERKALKTAKREKKERRRRKRAEAVESTSKSGDDAARTTTQTPKSAGQAALIGHQMVRQRYIQQKRRACMDPKALNEIFMIKTPV